MIAWIALGMCSGCDSPVQLAAAVEAVYPDPCTYADCGAHGTCHTGARGAPECRCEQGYQGERCDACAPEYHRDVEGACVRDTKCPDHEANLCGPHGSCENRPGGVGCACDPGYEGPHCSLCGSGYGRNEQGECLQLVIWLGGPDGGQGPLPQSCTATSCNGHGQCSQADGRVSCACFPGYQGTRCDVCAAGYVARAGRCSADASCGDGPACSLCERFGALEAFPARPDNCFSSETLNLAELSLSSLGGLGTVWLCGPSTAYTLGSEHVALEATRELPAEISFQTAIRTLHFDYALRSLGSSKTVQLEFLADGKVVGDVEDERKSTGPAEFQFDPPIRTFGIRSNSAFLEEIAIDNLVYELGRCD